MANLVRGRECFVGLSIVYVYGREERKRSYSEGPCGSPTEREPVLPLLQRSVRRSKKKKKVSP